jgi:hypothetical protein
MECDVYFIMGHVTYQFITGSSTGATIHLFPYLVAIHLAPVTLRVNCHTNLDHTSKKGFERCTLSAKHFEVTMGHKSITTCTIVFKLGFCTHSYLRYSSRVLAQEVS